MSNSFSRISENINRLHSLIDSYNNPETSTDNKSKQLESIHTIVQEILPHLSEEKGLEIKIFLKKIKKIQSADISLWNKIISQVESISPSISQISFEEIPKDLLVQILQYLDKQDIHSLANTNKYFHSILNNPQVLANFLERFSGRLSHEKRFALAIHCGKELRKLDLSFFPGLNFSLLNALQKECPNLQSLNLSGTAIKKLILPLNLRELNLDQCKDLPAKEIANINSLFKLEKLNVAGTAISNLDLPISLKDLSIESCVYLKDTEIKKLSLLKNLVVLNLKGSNIKDLNDVPFHIKKLSLKSCRNLSSDQFKKLSSFSNLDELDVSETTIDQISCLPKGLKKLLINNCDQLSTQELNKVDQSFTQLEIFEAINTNLETLNHLPKTLKELNLDGCVHLTADELNHLSAFQQLEGLDLTITNIAHLNVIPQTIKELILTGCNELNPDEFEKLSSLLSLENLNVSNTTIRTLNTLPQNLIEIRLKQCQNIEPREIRNLALHPKLKTIYLDPQFAEENQPILSYLEQNHKTVIFE